MVDCTKVNYSMIIYIIIYLRKRLDQLMMNIE